MSRLTIYPEDAGEAIEVLEDGEAIAERLAAIGVRFERWQADRPLAADAGEADILAAYAGPVARLKDEYGFASADVVRLTPDHPDREALRAKFLDEHTHSDFEVRFFVEGSGLFYLHAGGRVHAVLCEQGDLISVPAGTPHWFDMGERPHFTCIRLFTTPEGWVAQYTGADIARAYPRLEPGT